MRGSSGSPDTADSAAADGRTVQKPWGHELIWVQTPQYVGKILVIETGKRLSMQYHRKKDESIYVLSGKMRLHLEDDAGAITVRDLGPGQFARVKVGRKHRYEAVERVEVMEVSTPELDDVVRLEDDFGREGTSQP